MRYKAIMADIDGTIVDSPSQKLPSSEMRDRVAMLEKIGVQFSVVTGRPLSFARPIIQALGLISPCIIAGGTKIVDPRTEEELWAAFIPKDSMHQLLDFVKDKPCGYLWNDYTAEDYENGGWSISGFPADLPVYFFEIAYIPETEAMQFAQTISSIPDVTVTVVIAHRPGMRDIHVTHRFATKEHAIYKIEQILGADRSEMIGIGDGHNDLHLFAAVGHKVAMGNAVDELKQAADETIGSVQEQGLEKYLERKLKEWS